MLWNHFGSLLLGQLRYIGTLLRNIMPERGPELLPVIRKELRIVRPTRDGDEATKRFSGTGLGLWVSNEIVHRHRGRLSIKSSQKPGWNGTVVVLFLPFAAVFR